jgi:hypothetical protein
LVYSAKKTILDQKRLLEAQSIHNHNSFLIAAETAVSTTKTAS